ncbi:MAG: TonB-dependent receptor [Desulfuromonadales bacterium]
MQISRNAWLCLLVFSLHISVASADVKKDPTGYEAYSLGEIYVTGEKAPITQQTTTTNTITAEDIKATNSRTVAEALSYAPGVRVTTGMKNEPNISIRGFFDQSKILVLIDGVPYYETSSGKLDLNQFTTDNVAKIEITKGAASVLYGANAEGGVINIITKTATGKPVTSIEVEGGDVDYFKTALSHGMKKGIFSYWLNYDHQQSNGWRMSGDYIPKSGNIVSKPGGTTTAILEDGGTRNQSDYKSDSIWAKFGIEPSTDSEYFINFHYIAKEKGNPPSTNSVNVMPSKPAFSQFYRFDQYDDWGIDLSGRQNISDKLSFNGKLFYHNHVDNLNSYSDQTFSKIIARSNYDDYMVGGSLITHFQPVQWDTVRFAVNYRGDSHKQRADNYLPYTDFFSLTGSVGLENEVNPSKNFSIVFGVSYDWFKVTDAHQIKTDSSGNLASMSKLDGGASKDHFNPMIGSTYTFPDTTKLFASIAQKTRFPTLSQLFDTNSGNTALNAENAINYTVGASRAVSSYMWGELAFFYHDVSDFIIKETPTNNVSHYSNIGKVELYGIELNTEFYPLQDLTLKLAYTYNHATDLSDNRVTGLVANVPEHKIDLGASYTVPYVKTRLDLNGLLLGETYTQLPTPSTPTQLATKTAEYFIMNARVSQKFLDYFEAHVALNNIFDRNYESEVGFPGRGRSILGGITAKF